MTREEKGALIEELATKLKENQTFYIADASGMSVADTNSFRRLCFDKGIEYKVYKNTLIQKALEKIGDDNITESLQEALKGFSGILFAGEASNLPAKILKDFRKKKKDLGKPVLKGASIEFDVFLGDDKLTYLSELKSKDELIGDVIALLQSPAKNVVSALQSGEHKLAGLIKTLSEKEEA